MSDDRGRNDGTEPKPEVPWQVIVYNTADHYAEHLVDLKQWLENV